MSPDSWSRDESAANASSAAEASGWYGPPTSRRWHYIVGADARSLCGKWFVPAWSEELIDKSYGPANGDCTACKKALAAASPVPEEAQ